MILISVHSTRLARSRSRLFLLMFVLAAATGMSSLRTFSQPASNLSKQTDGRSARDPLFEHPYIDIDEWRSTPVRHHYVHGGFEGTDTKFSFYFPEQRLYKKRFFQHITPVPDNENLAQHAGPGEENKISFAIASGGYFVETNGGGANNIGVGDPTITAYRANAAAAEYSRVVAAKLYGPHRPYGYAFGGSGGAFRTIGSIENTTGVWDGVVPYVIGSTEALPNVFTVRIHAMRILWDKFPEIVDAMDAGGSGDPSASLNEEEKAAWQEVTKMGFPPQSWFGYRTMGVHGFAAIYPIIHAIDAKYFTDFWTVPGYLGAKPTESLLRARIQHDDTIKDLVSAKEALSSGIVLRQASGAVDNAFLAPGGHPEQTVAFRLTSPPPPSNFLGGDLIVKSGLAAGKSLQIREVHGDLLVLGSNDAKLVGEVASGDEVVLDTSDFLAAQTYHRHQVPGKDFPEWDQFRKPDGTPIYPQRNMLIGPMLVQNTAGSLEIGKIHGKMIVVESLLDREAYPWQADWYRKRVEEQLGAQFNDNFRLWYTDRALHGDETHQEFPTQTISYLGVLQQALRDLSAWVERGVPPPASTNYEIVDGQVKVPPTAAARRGIQPVISLQANDSPRAETKIGMPVMFRAVVGVPQGTGEIVEARWDFDGSGTFAVRAKLTKMPDGTWTISGRHTFSDSGTHFVTVRVVSQREGDANTPYARIQNLGRVRVNVLR